MRIGARHGGRPWPTYPRMPRATSIKGRNRIMPGHVIGAGGPHETGDRGREILFHRHVAKCHLFCLSGVRFLYEYAITVI